MYFQRMCLADCRFFFSLSLTFDRAGENANGGKGLREQAGEIMACEYPFFMGRFDVMWFNLIRSLIQTKLLTRSFPESLFFKT